MILQPYTEPTETLKIPSIPLFPAALHMAKMQRFQEALVAVSIRLLGAKWRDLSSER